jgi:outer membrane protein insertion porin family
MRSLTALALVAALALFAFVLATGEVRAQSETIVREIVVEGNQRIEPDTVKSYMAVQEGGVYNEQLIDLSLKTLFATGLFADVTIREEGGRVTVTVVENPIINRVAFEGNSKISDEDLEKEATLKPRTVFTRAKVQADVQRVVELYRRSGRFAAIVEPKVVQLPQNRVDLIYEINEGEATGINRINFLGNRAFSDSRLRDEIATVESAWWKFLTTNDNYDPDRLAFDREQLRRFYLTQGYADFRVISAVAELAPDRSGFFVTFTMEEGDEYTFGDISVESQIAELSPDVLTPLLLIESGDTYNAELIDKSIDALSFDAGTKGYAFAEVRPRVSRNRENRTIDIKFQVEQGPRVYVERINVIGNTRTLDRVIRREIRLGEADAFNRVLIDRSRSRIRGLGFFKKVEITEEPGNAPDRTILNVEVEEQPTGELSLGFGFSSADAFLADVSITERNLLGRGQFLRFRVSASDSRQQADIRFTEPYFMERNLAVGFDIFKILTQFQESSYETDSTGIGLRAGFPLSEFSRVNTRYTLRSDDYSIDPGAAVIIGIDLAGQTVTSVAGYTFGYSDIDDPLKPTSGLTFTFQQDFAGLGGDVSYYRSQVDATAFQKLFGWDEVVGSASVSAGWIDDYDGEGVRINDRFFKGGATFRGFEQSGVGPRDVVGSAKDAVGGQAYAVGTIEVRFPTGLPEDLGIDASLFTDFGTVGIVDDTTKASCLNAGAPPGIPGALCRIEDDLSLRASAGLSVLWDSPFGPVRLDFSQVLAKENYDKTENFRFSAGTKF